MVPPHANACCSKLQGYSGIMVMQQLLCARLRMLPASKPAVSTITSNRKSRSWARYWTKASPSSQMPYAPVLRLFPKVHPGEIESPLALKAISGECCIMATSRQPTSASTAKSRPAQKNRHRVVRRAYADYWDQLLESALASGELRDDTSTAMIRLFVIGALNWTVEWYNPQRGSFRDFSRQITGIVFDGILTHDKA